MSSNLKIQEGQGVEKMYLFYDSLKRADHP